MKTRVKNPELMKKIAAFVDQYYSDRHTSPSVNEIAKGVGIAKTTSYRYLVEMSESGMLEYDGPSRTIITQMIQKFSTDSNPCPVVGSVPCGTAEQKEECVREYVSLPVSLFGRGKFYILEAQGDSMVDAGIEDGDMVVVQTDCSPIKGDIVVALTGENENTLKEYEGIDKETHEAVLRYRNQKLYPGKEIRVRELTVQGVARHVLKAL